MGRLIDADDLVLILRGAAGLLRKIGNKERALAYEDLIAELNGMQSSWYSVEDELPIEKMNPMTLDYQQVICFCDFGGIPKQTDVRVFGFGRNHFYHGPQIMDGVVTHWMPLPDPPKEDEDA